MLSVSIPYRQAQNSGFDREFSRKRQCFNSLQVGSKQKRNSSWMSNRKFVSIPYRQAQNNPFPQLHFPPSLSFNSLQVGSKQYDLKFGVLDQIGFNSLQVGSKLLMPVSIHSLSISFNSLQVGSKRVEMVDWLKTLNMFQFLIGRLKT